MSGATLSAVFHGVRVLLRRLKPDGRGGFTPLAEAVTFTPVKPLRGMYFATHFGNFYHVAPIEEVLERYRKTLPEPIATGRTFRLLYLRSVADEELIARDGDPLASGRSVAALEEIDRIYHVTDTTSVWVRTPVWRLHPEAKPEHCAV